MPPPFTRAPFTRATAASTPGVILLPLRAFLAVVYLDGGISKIADRRFLDNSSLQSLHAAVLAARPASPIGGWLGPVADHSAGFGVILAAAELAVGLGLLLGLFVRIAALGGMVMAFGLWLTVSWSAQPWYTSADLLYLFAFTPLLIGGAGRVLSLDGWLERARREHPGAGEDRTRRGLLATGAVLLGAITLGGAALSRRGRPGPAAPGPTPAAPVGLIAADQVPVGGAAKVTDSADGDPAWVVQLTAGQFTAYDAVCPHQGCTVEFVSASAGFGCPCHGSRFDIHGGLVNGPATRGLTAIPVSVQDGEVRAT